MENVDKDIAGWIEKMSRLDRLTESKKIQNKLLSENVAPSLLKKLVAQYEQGEITLDQLKDEIDSAEHTDYTMRQGEMGNPDMRDDMNFSHRDEADWAQLEEPNEFDDDDDVYEQVDKSKIPAAQRKASGKEDWKTTMADLDKEDESRMSSRSGLDKLQKDTEVKESADPEVLEWMGRFAKLGKMTGYNK